MKTPTDQKPVRVYCLTRYTGEGEPIRFLHANLLQAVKPLDRADYLIIEGKPIPVSLLRDILATWDKDTKKKPHGPSDMQITHIERYAGESPLLSLVFREYPDTQPRNRQVVYIQPLPEAKDLERAGAVVCVLDLHEHQPETVKPDKWLSLAVAKGDYAAQRPNLAKIWGNLAADGFRLHRDITQPDPTSCPFDWHVVYPKPSDNVALVHTGRLLKAIKGAKVIARDGSNTVRLFFNGRLDVTATSEEFGNFSSTIPADDGYQHTGADMEIGMDPKYLIEALSGMDDEVVISLVSPSAPILITDGKREAVIMPRLLK